MRAPRKQELKGARFWLERAGILLMRVLRLTSCLEGARLSFDTRLSVAECPLVGFLSVVVLHWVCFQV